MREEQDSFLPLISDETLLVSTGDFLYNVCAMFITILENAGSFSFYTRTYLQFAFPGYFEILNGLVDLWMNLDIWKPLSMNTIVSVRLHRNLTAVALPVPLRPKTGGGT